MGKKLIKMAETGKEIYKLMIPLMKKNFKKSKERAVKNFEKLPFGKKIKEAYKEAWEYMPEEYEKAMDEEKAEEWFKEWIRKMSED